jgi:hypothetical protein
MYNLKGKDQQKDMYTNELYRICTMVGVPIKSIDLADRNMNIIDVLKKNVKKSVVTPVVKEEGFTNILPDNNIIDSLKNYLKILIFILIFFYICKLYIE